MKFVNIQEKDKYTCSICLDILSPNIGDPDFDVKDIDDSSIETYCGHLFHKKCYGKIQICPICKYDLSNIQIPTRSIGKFLSREIKNIMVEYSDILCENKIVFYEYDNHIKTCKYKQVKCLCSLLISRKDFETHKCEQLCYYSTRNYDLKLIRENISNGVVYNYINKYFDQNINISLSILPFFRTNTNIIFDNQIDIINNSLYKEYKDTGRKLVGSWIFGDVEIEIYGITLHVLPIHAHIIMSIENKHYLHNNSNLIKETYKYLVDNHILIFSNGLYDIVSKNVFSLYYKMDNINDIRSDYLNFIDSYIKLQSYLQIDTNKLINEMIKFMQSIRKVPWKIFNSEFKLFVNERKHIMNPSDIDIMHVFEILNNQEYIKIIDNVVCYLP